MSESNGGYLLDGRARLGYCSSWAAAFCAKFGSLTRDQSMLAKTVSRPGYFARTLRTCAASFSPPAAAQVVHHAHVHRIHLPHERRQVGVGHREILMAVDVDEWEFCAAYRRLPGDEHGARFVLLDGHRAGALLLVATDLGVRWRGEEDTHHRDQHGPEMAGSRPIVRRRSRCRWPRRRGAR